MSSLGFNGSRTQPLTNLLPTPTPLFTLVPVKLKLPLFVDPRWERSHLDDTWSFRIFFGIVVFTHEREEFRTVLVGSVEVGRSFVRFVEEDVGCRERGEEKRKDRKTMGDGDRKGVPRPNRSSGSSPTH